MSAQEIPFRNTLRSLWRRAPLWRFTGMSAALLTLLFALFPPEGNQNARSALTVPPASYVSKTPALPKTQTPHSIIATPQQLFTPSAPQPSSPQPQTANVSFALPGPKDPKQEATGLERAQTGRLYSGSIKLNGFKLPLVEGEWALLSAAKMDVPTAIGVGYFLGQIENKRLKSAMIAYALRSKPDATEATSSFSTCAFSFSLYTAVDDNVPKDHQSCWMIHGFFTPPWQQWGDKDIKLNNLIRAAAGDMASKGVTYPQDFVVVEFLRNEKWGTLDVAYLFDPTGGSIEQDDALSFLDSDWVPANINRYPEKLAYIEKQKQWGTSLWPQIQSAFAAGK
ncbi:MAG: hypothetical protein WCD70_05965 [Alphaproteobacteria bacterium]